MGGIFISYRRDDTEGHAGRLYDALVRRFGKQAVFLDVDGIQPGADFHDVIESTVRSCDIVLPLIGKRWLDVKDAAGKRRLDDKEDVLRRELECALTHGVTTIPLLVHGAQMPGPASLPPTLAPLAGLNAFELRHTRWDGDVALLLDKLAAELGAAPAPGDATDAPVAKPASNGGVLSVRAARRRSTAGLATACVVTLVALYLLGAFLFQLQDYVLLAAWLVVGAGFGAWHVVKRGASWGRDLGLAIAIALAAALLMSGLTSLIDAQPFWPQNWPEWRYTSIHVALIALGFLAGSFAGRSQRLRALLR